MAYSNIALPTFPEYDTAAYPYGVGVLNYELDKEDWYEFHLWYSATPFTWNGSAVVNTGTAYSHLYGNYEEVTGWSDAFETDVEAAPGLNKTTYQRIWTNHDILDADGNVWLPAGEVTPAGETVSDVWLRSFKTGLALGLLGKPLPFKCEQWETLFEAQEKSNDPYYNLNNHYNGYLLWLWDYQLERDTNVLVSGDKVRVTLDGTMYYIDVTAHPEYPDTTVTGGNYWLSLSKTATDFTDEGIDFGFWELDGGLRGFTRTKGTHSIKFERLVRESVPVCE